MTLTIGVAVVVGLLGLVGLFGGIRRGLIAIAGTLLAAMLVELWQERWEGWLRASFRPEQPDTPSFLLTAGIFLGVVVLVGYGGSAIVARPDPKAKGPGLLNNLLGALVGALNGVLVVGYLLRYAAAFRGEGWLAAELAASPLAGLLDDFLPSFILATVIAAAVFVILRTTVRIGRVLTARPAAPASGQVEAAAGQAGGKQPAAGGSVAGSTTLHEADQKINAKINQTLGNDGR